MPLLQAQNMQKKFLQSKDVKQKSSPKMVQKLNQIKTYWKLQGMQIKF